MGVVRKNTHKDLDTEMLLQYTRPYKPCERQAANEMVDRWLKEVIAFNKSTRTRK